MHWLKDKRGFVLRPYFVNVGKRLVKTSKIYFTDVGTLCYLSGLKDPEHAASGPMGGTIFETAVVTEIFKTIISRGIEPQMYFWRTSSGMEVDIVVESNYRVVPIEVKLSSTPRPAMAQSIKAFRGDFGDKALDGYVLHAEDIHLPLGSGVTPHCPLLSCSKGEDLFLHRSVPLSGHQLGLPQGIRLQAGAQRSGSGKEEQTQNDPVISEVPEAVPRNEGDKRFYCNHGGDEGDQAAAYEERPLPVVKM